MNLPQQTSLPHAFLFYHIQFAMSTLLQNFYKMQACLAETRRTVSRKSIFMIASPERGGGPAKLVEGFFAKSFYDVFGISGNPSVSATHCQL
ncbi:MAG: hypothetical protein ACLR7O_07520, partial [Ruminococcus callidus]